MRFEVWAAYAMGIGLPVLEVCRRGTNFDHFANYADDFLEAGLLLWAAIASSRRRRTGPVLLIVAWAIVCGGFYFSIFGQIQSTSPTDVSGLSNLTVILIKACLYAVALAGLIASSKRVVDRLESR